LTFFFFFFIPENSEFYNRGRSLRDRITSFKQDNSVTSDTLETIASNRGANFFVQIILSHNRSILQQYRKMLALFFFFLFPMRLS